VHVGIVDDLGEAEDAVFILVVEAVNEDERVPALDMLLEPDPAFLDGIDLVDARHREIGRRIWRQALRPLHRAGLALGRNGDRDFGQIRLGAALAIEKRRRIAGGLTRRCDQHVDLRRLRRCRREQHRGHDAARMAAGRQQKQH
jgi:hypothetical protein